MAILTQLTAETRIDAFIQLGTEISETISSFDSIDENANEFPSVLKKTVRSAFYKNHWFTHTNVLAALKGIAEWLNKKDLSSWYSDYSFAEKASPATVALIMAGNIPLVGFHDMLCVLISGNTLLVKASSDDNVLPQLLMKRLCEIEPEFANRIIFTEQVKSPDAVIATGSDNSARYFEYYFGKYPNIIRKNRNSVAVLTGKESKTELESLGQDIFRYFGLGCRNVSKLMVPDGYDFNAFFEAMATHSSILEHNKYCSNHDYYSALLLLKRVPFLTNNFLIIKEAKELATPVSILNYEFYADERSLIKSFESVMDQIQCIVGDQSLIPGALDFGKTQNPGLRDYADRVDTMLFLSSLN